MVPENTPAFWSMYHNVPKMWLLAREVLQNSLLLVPEQKVEPKGCHVTANIFVIGLLLCIDLSMGWSVS